MKIKVLLYLFIISFGLFAQTEQDSIYYDIEVDSTHLNFNQKNCFKVDLISTSIGKYDIYYERVIINKINFELKAGLFAPNFFYYILNPEVIDIRNGYSLGSGIKYYFKESFQGIFTQLDFNHMNYNKQNLIYNQEFELMELKWVNYTVNSLRLSCGYSYRFKKRILYEHQAGISYNGKRDIKPFGALKIGILF